MARLLALALQLAVGSAQRGDMAPPRVSALQLAVDRARQDISAALAQQVQYRAPVPLAGGEWQVRPIPLVAGRAMQATTAPCQQRQLQMLCVQREDMAPPQVSALQLAVDRARQAISAALGQPAPPRVHVQRLQADIALRESPQQRGQPALLVARAQGALLSQ